MVVNNAAVEIKKFRLDEIAPARYNPRVISDDAFEGLCHSISKFGCVEPIVVNIRGGENIIVGGHQRHRALVAEGIEECLCVTVDLSDGDERLLNLTLNNPAAQGEFIEKLDEYIDQLRVQIDNDEDLFDLRIDALMGELSGGKDGLVDEDAAGECPAEKDVVTKLGDLWRLGEHLLLCGDCLDLKTVSSIQRFGEADLVFTDPPYNMDYRSKNLGGIKNDKMRQADFVRFILQSVVTIRQVLRPGGSYYICMSAAEYPTVYHQLRKLEMGGRQIVWVKPSTGMGAQEYRPQFEVMLYGYLGKRAERTWNGRRKESDRWEFGAGRDVVAREDGKGMTIEVGAGIDTTQIILDKRCGGRVVEFSGETSDLWKFARPRGDYVHPTQKPVALVERAVKNSSNRGDVVFDCFGGSGSTPIACEKLDRKCRVIELDPKYCDVIVAGWEAFAGKKAELRK